MSGRKELNSPKKERYPRKTANSGLGRSESVGGSIPTDGCRSFFTGSCGSVAVAARGDQAGHHRDVEGGGQRSIHVRRAVPRARHRVKTKIDSYRYVDESKAILHVERDDLFRESAFDRRHWRQGFRNETLGIVRASQIGQKWPDFEQIGRPILEGLNIDDGGFIR